MNLARSLLFWLAIVLFMLCSFGTSGRIVPRKAWWLSLLKTEFRPVVIYYNIIIYLVFFQHHHHSVFPLKLSASYTIILETRR